MGAMDGDEILRLQRVWCVAEQAFRAEASRYFETAFDGELVHKTVPVSGRAIAALDGLDEVRRNAKTAYFLALSTTVAA
jgi:hypothetical protein